MFIVVYLSGTVKCKHCKTCFIAVSGGVVDFEVFNKCPFDGYIFVCNYEIGLKNEPYKKISSL
jgi:hypothetical protein